MRGTNIRIAKLHIEGQEIINTQISTYKTKSINYCLSLYFSPLLLFYPFFSPRVVDFDITLLLLSYIRASKQTRHN